MNNRKRLLTIGGILAGAVVIAVVMVQLRPDPPRRPPAAEAPLVMVGTAAQGQGPIRVHGSGSVRPRSEIDVAAEVGGKIVEVSPNMQSGGQVRAGEVLLRIDPSDYENRVEQAEAEVAGQRVAVLQAEEEAQIAQSEYERFRERENRRGVAAGEPSPLTLRQPQLDAARASLARAEASLRDARLALERTRVVSPFDGRVRRENVSVGAFVAPGQSLGRIYASDVVEVIVPLSDDDAVLVPNLWSLQAGDDDRSIRATVYNDYGDRRFQWEGYVDRAESALDEQTRTIDIIVRVPDPFRPGTESGDATVGATRGPPLLVGQFAEVEIEGFDPEQYFVAPRRALRPGNEIWAVQPDNTVKIVPVRVLQEIDEQVFVTGDLTDGQPVITAGISIATDGMRVRLNGSGGGG